MDFPFDNFKILGALCLAEMQNNIIELVSGGLFLGMSQLFKCQVSQNTNPLLLVTSLATALSGDVVSDLEMGGEYTGFS